MNSNRQATAGATGTRAGRDHVGAEGDPGRGRGGGVGGGHQAEPRGLARAGRGPRQRRDSQDPGEQAALQTLVRADQSWWASSDNKHQ